MNKIDLEKIKSLYEKIEIEQTFIKQNIEILKEIYNLLGKELRENEENINLNKFFIEKITKITREILDNLTVDEKLRLKQCIPEVILICLLNDNEKIKKVQYDGENLFDYDEKLIAESLKYTDNEKVELVKKIKDNPVFIIYVVSTIRRR